MKLIESYPGSKELQRYIDRYQFFDIQGSCYLKTIPNGKIDFYTILEGGFEIWDSGKEEFIQVPEFGYLPATNKPSVLKISENLVCLNVKMNLNVLALPCFFEMYTGNPVPECINEIWKCISFIWESGQMIRSGEIEIKAVEEKIGKYYESEYEDPKINAIVKEIENADQFSVIDLANYLHVSPRTLNRLTQKYFNFSPKDLATILRFEKTTSYLKVNESEGLIEALSFGYYDQSHFIKECKKITGTSPKKFFSRMELPTNDLLVERVENVL